MGPSRPSNSDFFKSPTLPSYKSEEEHEEEEEEDVGLLSATSNRLQHIASQRLLGRSSRSRWYRLLVLPVLALTVFFLGAVAIAGIVVYTRDSGHGGSQNTGSRKKVFSLAGELNGLVPEFEVKPVVFGKDPLATSDHKTEASANATEGNWRSYKPVGQGFIAVDDPSQYTLPQPIDFQDQTVYSISVFHQLHCLYTIMQAYNSLSEPNHDHNPPSAASQGHTRRDNGHHNPSHSQGHTNHNHIDHCFRYLRQSVVCCGDTALEGQDLNHPELSATDGTGAVHLCKDYRALKGWAEERRLTEAV
ncbi:uncharacterized protein B0T23DRAFT_448009 [Neurospora hispaniola]|uniref:Tat pathway signal sequence n=1 Tax=Neurospora hispaniola TaxID=588809 RepID=A0AAJ0I180_9PEZI|nr:hypothetical protein B0T23DRAFT_448009 [Neurospora hispaniola]